MLSFLAVGAVLAVVLFGLIGTDGDESNTDDDDTASSTTIDVVESTTSTSVDTTPDVSLDPSSSCSADQFPRADVRYRVSAIPDTFPEPTLNGRNVPSTTEVGGVESRPITTFLEFTELDLDYGRCEVAENGRVWWAVDYTGPDDAGGTFSGIVWSSTRFIEVVPG